VCIDADADADAFFLIDARSNCFRGFCFKFFTANFRFELLLFSSIAVVIKGGVLSISILVESLCDAPDASSSQEQVSVGFDGSILDALSGGGFDVEEAVSVAVISVVAVAVAVAVVVVAVVVGGGGGGDDGDGNEYKEEDLWIIC
jgi:hypothetical protein